MVLLVPSVTPASRTVWPSLTSNMPRRAPTEEPPTPQLDHHQPRVEQSVVAFVRRARAHRSVKGDPARHVVRAIADRPVAAAFQLVGQSDRDGARVANERKPCRQEPTRCARRRVYGITYSANDGLLGGWAEAIWMKPGVKMIRLPNGLAPETFIGGGCGLVTALHAVDIAGIRLEDFKPSAGAGPGIVLKANQLATAESECGRFSLGASTTFSRSEFPRATRIVWVR